uniref:Uncharacterized protein n=1 Tax=Arundo donax TaxID=35708 RepID=A0A0A9FT54_ARUDO
MLRQEFSWQSYCDWWCLICIRIFPFLNGNARSRAVVAMYREFSFPSLLLLIYSPPLQKGRLILCSLLFTCYFSLMYAT